MPISQGGVVTNPTPTDPSGGIDPEAINQAWIETKTAWSDPWEWQPELVPISCEVMAGSQGLGSATFRLFYGPQIKEWWADAFESVDKFGTLAGAWIRIRVVIDETPVTLFCGRVEAPQEQISGDQTQNAAGAEKPQGVQHWIAYGPLKMLERMRFARSYWEKTSDHTALELEWLPDINIRHGDVNPVGNRSDNTIPNGGNPVYVFGGSSTWTARNVLDHAINFYANAPVAVPNADRPEWRSAGDLFGAGSIQNLTPQIRWQSVNNMRELCSQLIPLDRGNDFVPEYWETVNSSGVTTDEGFQIRVFGLVDASVNASFEGYDALKNYAVNPINASDSKAHRVTIERANIEKYDKVRISGDRIISVMSVGDTSGTTNLAGTLIRGWTAAEEAAYLAGDTTGGALADAHAAYRRDERFRYVFQKFLIDMYSTGNFNFQSGTANPVFAADGSVSVVSGNSSKYQSYEIGTLAKLPLLAGWDYTTATPTSRNPYSTQIDYLPPIVYLKDTGRTGKFVPANKANALNPHYPNCEVSALEHDIGVLLRADPNHVLAKNHWSGAKPDRFDPTLMGFDWTSMVATIAVETDHRPFVEKSLDAGFKSNDGSVKDMFVPTAQYWWLSPYTVVGVSPAGVLLRAPSAGVALRNDIELLKSYMPGVIARFQYERLRATVQRDARIENWAGFVGTILGLTGEQGELDTKPPITAVRWDFEKVTTTLYAGHAERQLSKFIGER